MYWREVRPSAIALLIVGLTAAAGLALIFQVGPFRPTVTCALADPAPCQDTADSILFPGSDSLYPPPQGLLVAIDVRPAPAEWADSIDPGFQSAEWAARLKVAGSEPVLTACYYSSGDEVMCDTDEAP